MDAGSPSWTVKTQVESMGLGPNGGAVKGVTVGFALSDGTAGTVFVPEAQFTADNVRAAIAAKVEVLQAVKGLSG